MVNFDFFHIEPTSKCTLECPLCERTWFYETFKKRNLHEINIDHLVAFVGANASIDMNGNNGDPIYHSRFLELCERLKNNNCKIMITTNGSAKTKEWWEKLNNILDEDDIVQFSIDGLEDTNHLYRKNAKWDSIMKAVKVFAKRKCTLRWKYIVFKHNQHQIKEAKELSLQLGFDHFRLEHSDRWLGKKELMPDREFVDNHYQQQQKVLIDPTYTTNMEPMCLVGNQLYIDAEGDFYPCCWMGTYRYKYKSLFSPKESTFNIGKSTLDDILNNIKVKEFFESTKQFTSAHDCCKIQCGKKNG
jgi:sulfatase maturation enzyme AslB (radical SAM superfamily)